MIINQSLHGYDHGHDKLASSVNLSIEDDNLMKVMSDWTGFTGLSPEDMSYITCYTLPKSGFFVVAKTWYADEMPRPGCVWTHSLILDLNMSDDAFDFRKLQKYFIRPVNGDYSYYFKKVALNDDNGNSNLKVHSLNIDSSQAAYLIYHLATHGKEKICIETTNDFYQNLCLCLLEYLPIHIIHGLSLCTGTDYKRRADNTFNLIFSRYSSRSLKECQYSNVGYDVADNGVLYIASAIINGDSDDQLFRMFSDDIGKSSDLYWLTGWLLSMLDDQKQHSTIEYNKILTTITKAYPSVAQGLITKRLFLRQNVAKLFVDEEQYSEVLCTSFESTAVDWKNIGLDDFILSLLNSYNKKINFLGKLIKYDDINDLGQAVLKKEAYSFTDNDISRIAKEQWDIYIVLLQYNYLILNGDYWLELSNNKIEWILPYIIKHPEIEFKNWNKLFEKCIGGSITQNESFLAQIYRQTSNPSAVLMGYIQKNSYKSVNNTFLKLLTKDIPSILRWLEHSLSINDYITFFILNNIGPQSSEVKNYGIKAWQSFYNFEKTRRVTLQYYIFLFLLALNWKGPIALSMLKNSFYHVYLAMASSELTSAQMQKISAYMPDLPIWQSWDNCKKLCKGTVKAIISLGYKKNDIIGFTPNEDINKRMWKIWKKQTS